MPVCGSQIVSHFFDSQTQVWLLPTKLISQVPRPRIEPRTPGMISRHSTPQLQSMDKRSVWKHPQESHNFDMSVLDFIRNWPISSFSLLRYLNSIVYMYMYVYIYIYTDIYTDDISTQHTYLTLFLQMEI